MSSTYSINPGSSTEAFKLADIQSVLNELPDNTSKLINPHDLRDGIYTAWENIVIKPTTNTANIEYIGIDKSDFFEKILLGKKNLSGSTFILNSSLLNSDVDIFLYNTKTNVDLTNQNTRIGLLAGADTSLFYYGSTLSIPLIESKVVSTAGGSVLNLDIKNFSYAQSGAVFYGGDINIYSNYGNVWINGLRFPKLSENIGITNSYILTYQSGGYLQWTPNTVTVNSINETGTFSITANPLYINGYNAMFSSSVPIPAPIGSISIGSTFSNVAVTEMLRLILYPYVQPTLSLSCYTPVVEYSSSTINLTFSYTVTKYVASSTVSVYSNSPIFIADTLAQTYLNAAATTPRSYTGTGSYASSMTIPLTFTLSVKDQTGTYSVGTNVTPVYPIFYGTTTVATSSQSGISAILGTFSKLITNNPNQTVTLTGNGVCIYYLVPQVYNLSGSMSALYSGSSASFNQNSAFRGNGTPFTMSLNSPSSLWTSVVYNCYVYSPSGTAITTTIGNYPLYSSTYQFVF